MLWIGNEGNNPVSKVIIGIGDMHVSRDPGDTLVTYALGSCLGLTVYDPQMKVGGMIHVALPDSTPVDSRKDNYNPLRFVDSGIPLLFKEAYRLGARKAFLRVRMAGCSQIADEGGLFNIGKRNYAAARKLLWRNNVLIEAEHCGDSFSRTMSFEIDSGRIVLRIGREEFEL